MRNTNEEYKKLCNEMAERNIKLIKEIKQLKEKFHKICQKYEGLWSKYCNTDDEFIKVVKERDNLKQKLEEIDKFLIEHSETCLEMKLKGYPKILGYSKK